MLQQRKESLERYANDKEMDMLSAKQVMSPPPPDRVHSGIRVTPMSERHIDNQTANDNAVQLDDADDVPVAIVAAATNEFLLDLKEELVLQSLLHKRIHEKKERVLSLVHRNGRRLLVVLPPDTQSVATFEEEANKTTKWIDIMLNTEERIDGMLLYLAKKKPTNFVRIAKTRKLSTRTVALNTGQTIALARVGGLNDTSRMRKIRSFLKQVGKVNLQMSVKEHHRLDLQVGLHRTTATIGSCLHDWTATVGKDTKAPEQVHCWNCNLSSEIEAEVDLYFMHLFLSSDKTLDTMPVLDYVAGGFDKPGITVLFGGDHGDKNCPIS